MVFSACAPATPDEPVVDAPDEPIVDVPDEPVVDAPDEPVDGLELLVFGPNDQARLARYASPEEQQQVEQEVISGFLAEIPEVDSVDWDAQGQMGQDATRLLTAYLAGEEMDLIFCAANPTNGTWAHAGVLKDITYLVDPIRDRFYEASLDAYTIGGSVYGVPASPVSTSTFYYNKSIFSEVGVEPPSTFEEFVQISEEISDAGYIPVLHCGAFPLLWPIWYFETAAQTMVDPIAKTESNLRGETKFTDPEDIEALEWIARFVENGILDSGSLAVDRDGMRAAFAQQETAMIYGGSWEMPWLDGNVSEFEYGVFSFPKLTGTPGDPKHGGGPDVGFCIPANIPDERIPYAYAFIEYVTRPEIARKYFETESAIAVSIKDTGVGLEGEIGEYLRANNYPNTIRFLDWIWPAEISDGFKAVIQGVVGGTLSAEEGMARIQATFENLVEEGYEFGN